jgi:hypothetical protein
MSEPFDLESTVVHLGTGSTAVPVDGADWSQEWLERYQRDFAGDGDDGRMVCVVRPRRGPPGSVTPGLGTEHRPR